MDKTPKFNPSIPSYLIENGSLKHNFFIVFTKNFIPGTFYQKSYCNEASLKALIS